LVWNVFSDWADFGFIIRPEHAVLVGVGCDWINLPGTIIGFFAGLHSARATIRKAKEKKEAKRGQGKISDQ